MAPGVVPEPVPVGDHPVDDRAGAADLLADGEEHRLGVVAGEQVEDLRGVGAARAVVEGEVDDRTVRRRPIGCGVGWLGHVRRARPTCGDGLLERRDGLWARDPVQRQAGVLLERRDGASRRLLEDAVDRSGWVAGLGQQLLQLADLGPGVADPQLVVADQLQRLVHRRALSGWW